MNQPEKRLDGREPGAIRPITIQRQYTKYSPGSVLISFGETKVLCTASIAEKVPHFLRDSGRGWITAEYSMLPSATHTRMDRELKRGKPSGRTSEIQRLIGRSLRSVVNFEALGERTIHIDADVIQADGGTRTAAITGSIVALSDAIAHLKAEDRISVNPLRELLAAVSVGVVDGQVYCDLCYEEDSSAEVDMNIVMTESGQFVEVQGTGEEHPFSQDQFHQLLESGKHGVEQLISVVKSELAIVAVS